jgi:uncharacterized membrane protein
MGVTKCFFIFLELTRWLRTQWFYCHEKAWKKRKKFDNKAKIGF